MTVLMDQYKPQVLSCIDYTIAVVYHAPAFFLQSIDKVQNEFLNELGLSASEALHQFNLAPLCSTRDISLLGLLHRVVLKDAPVQFSSFIRPNIENDFVRGWAYQFNRHSHQLYDPLSSPVPKIAERSIFKLIHPYNCLPQFVVDSKTTSNFQSKLQRALKECASQNVLEWESFLSVGVYKHRISGFRSHFKP